LANCWHAINIGDVAHAPGMLQLIATHLPGTEVTLWPSPTYPNAGPTQPWIDATNRMLRAAFPRLKILAPGGTKDGRIVSPELAAAVEAADLLIVGSGGFHTKEAQAWTALTRKPFGGYGNTFSGMSGEALYGKASFLFCRDSPSVKLLQDGGVKGPEVAFGPDSTFGLALRDEARAESYLRKVGLEPKKFLGVIPRLRHSPYPEIYGFAASEREKENARVNAQFKSIDHAACRELIVNWVRTTGQKVLACPEMIYGVPLAQEELVDPLPADVRRSVVWRDSFWLCDEAASVLARATALVSLDCHAPIIALANGTPAIHLRVETDNLTKSRMFADIGLPEWIQENSGMTGDRLTAMVMEIHRDPAAARRKVARALEFVRARQTETMRTVRATLERVTG
jgi:polysaccharide pyruvyl transferase WcaK-like protein